MSISISSWSLAVSLNLNHDHLCLYSFDMCSSNLVPDAPWFVAMPSQGRQLCAHMEGLKQTRESVGTVISMKEQCGAGVWYRVGYLNMNNPSQCCCTNWIEYSISISGVQACGRSDDNSCLSAFYNTDQKYAKVCGGVITYQFSSPDAFVVNMPSSSVDDVYANEVSVTYGAHPCRHI